mgnify:CR=1 FL=1
MQNFDDVLLELSYRVGIVDLTKEYQVTELINILKEEGYQTPEELANKARVYFSYLKEIDEENGKRKQRVKGKSAEDPDINYVDSKGKKHSIKLSSAVNYDNNHPAYKAAMQYFTDKSAKEKPGQSKKPSTPNVKGKSVFGKDKGGKVFEPEKKSQPKDPKVVQKQAKEIAQKIYGKNGKLEYGVIVDVDEYTVRWDTDKPSDFEYL